MKKILFLSTSILLLIFTECDQKSTNEKEEGSNVDTTAAKKEIIAVMDSMNNAFKSKNATEMTKFLTDDGMYYGTDPGEMWNKKQLSDEFATMAKDTVPYDFTISHRDVMLDDDRRSAIVVEQYMFPAYSKHIMFRGIARVDKKDNGWRVDFYSWNLIPKNADMPKLDKALE